MMEIKLNFREIFEQEYQGMKNEPDSYLGYYRYLTGFMNQPIEFKSYDNSWCGLEELIYENHRSDYRRLSQKGVRQQIKDNAEYIKSLAKEYKDKFGFSKKRLKREKRQINDFLNYIAAAWEHSQHYYEPTTMPTMVNYEDNTIECLRQMGYNVE